jgi:hypothetical protein
MGFSVDPQKCLDEAARDLRHMGCAIFCKQCQEVNTIFWQILLGVPNSIKEQSIHQVMDNKLAKNNNKYQIKTMSIGLLNNVSLDGSSMQSCKSSHQRCHGRGQRRRNRSMGPTTLAWRTSFMCMNQTTQG